MPIIRIDPPKRGRTYSTAVAKGATEGYVKGGAIGAVVGALEGLTLKRDASRHNVPVEVNTDTGQVTALLQESGKHHGQARDLARQQRQGDLVAPVLEKIYRDGVMRDVPKQYRETAKIVQELSFSNPYTPPARDYSVFEGIADHADRGQTRPDPSEDFDMAGFIPPGGMAGFAQMTGASRIALTRGARGGGVRRARRRKGRPRRVGRPKSRRPTARKASGRRKAGRRRKLVKGSPEAKRFMANLRKRRA